MTISLRTIFLVSGIQVNYFSSPFIYIAWQNILLQLQFRRSGTFKRSNTEDAALRKIENKLSGRCALIRRIIHFTNSTKKQGFLKLMVRHGDTTKHSQSSHIVLLRRILTFVKNKVVADFCPYLNCLFQAIIVDFPKTGHK